MATLRDLKRPIRPAPDEFVSIATAAGALGIPTNLVVALMQSGGLDGCIVPSVSTEWIVTAESVLHHLNEERAHRPGRPLEYIPATGKHPLGDAD